MSLLDVAELLAGEAQMTPGGPVDRVTLLDELDDVWPAMAAVWGAAAAASPGAAAPHDTIRPAILARV